MGSSQRLSAVQVTVAVVALPVSSSSGSGVLLAAPLASFQFVLATTPALSLLAIALPSPTKSMLMVLAEEATKTVTVRATVVVCESDPLVPVIVRVVGPPTGGLVPAVMVIVDVVPGVIEAGLKPADAPVGRPLTPKVTEPVNPLRAP